MRLIFSFTVLSVALVSAAPTKTVINVREFGAVADGITDDSPAIQSAIDAAVDGDVIYLPAGIYGLATSFGGFPMYPDGSLIRSALVLSQSQIEFRGDGARASVLKLLPATKMRVLTATGHDLWLHDFGIDGNKSQRNGTVAWPDGDVVDALLYFKETGGTISVSDCDIGDAIEDGIGFWMTGPAYVDRCSLHDNGTAAAGAGGVMFGSQGGRASQNIVTRNTAGITVSWGSRSLQITDNVITDNSGPGLAVGDIYGIGQTASDLTIAGNTLSGNGIDGFAALWIVGASNGRIDGNEAIDNYREGIYVAGQGSLPSSGWTITNNICSDTRRPKRRRTQSHGIRLLGMSEATLVGNTCENNGTRLADQVVIEPPALVNSDWMSANAMSYH